MENKKRELLLSQPKRNWARLYLACALWCLCYALYQAALEPSCFKKWQKSTCQETGLWNRGLLKALNDTKFILNNWRSHWGSFRTNLVSFWTFRYPLLAKPVSWQGLFCYFLQQSGSSWIFLSGDICTKWPIFCYSLELKAWDCLTDVWMINSIKRRCGRTWFLDLMPGNSTEGSPTIHIMANNTQMFLGKMVSTLKYFKTPVVTWNLVFCLKSRFGPWWLDLLIQQPL